MELLEANLAERVDFAFQILLFLFIGVLWLLGALVEGGEVLEFLSNLLEYLLIGLFVGDLAVELLLLHEQVHLELVLVGQRQEDLDVLSLAAEG